MGYGLPVDPFTSEDGWRELDRLLARRWTMDAIVSASGLPRGTVSAILWELSTGVRRRLNPGTAAAICSHGNPTAGKIGATGSIRRARALMRYGYDRRALAVETGLPQSAVNRVLRGDTARIIPDHAATWTTTYDRLLTERPGRSWEAAQDANRQGWPGPNDWLGHDLDDPGDCLDHLPGHDQPTPTRRQATRRRKDVVRWRAKRARQRAAQGGPQGAPGGPARRVGTPVVDESGPSEARVTP